MMYDVESAQKINVGSCSFRAIFNFPRAPQYEILELEVNNGNTYYCVLFTKPK
jgi:hypothetical protein